MTIDISLTRLVDKTKFMYQNQIHNFKKIIFASNLHFFDVLDFYLLGTDHQDQIDFIDQYRFAHQGVVDNLAQYDERGRMAIAERTQRYSQT